MTVAEEENMVEEHDAETGVITRREATPEERAERIALLNSLSVS